MCVAKSHLQHLKCYCMHVCHVSRLVDSCVQKSCAKCMCKNQCHHEQINAIICFRWMTTQVNMEKQQLVVAWDYATTSHDSARSALATLWCANCHVPNACATCDVLTRISITDVQMHVQNEMCKLWCANYNVQTATHWKSTWCRKSLKPFLPIPNDWFA